jgi:hypothetical protein
MQKVLHVTDSTFAAHDYQVFHNQRTTNNFLSSYQPAPRFLFQLSDKVNAKTSWNPKISKVQFEQPNIKLESRSRAACKKLGSRELRTWNLLHVRLFASDVRSNSVNEYNEIACNQKTNPS